MARITIQAMNDAIETTLGAAAGLERSESYDELTEAIPDSPLLQVYPEAWGPARTGPTHAITGGGGVRNFEAIFFADVYGRQRSSIGEDMAILLPVIDDIEAILEAEKAKPYFGLAEIESFNWEARRVTFVYGGDVTEHYMGTRYTITLRVY